MITALHSEVLVVLMDESCVPGLSKASQTHRWSVLRQPTAGQALREIRLSRPSVVLVQVTGSVIVLKQASALVRWLRQSAQRTRVVAVASEHDERIEQVMRSSGVNGYLADDATDAQIKNIVAGLNGEHRGHRLEVQLS